MHVLRANLQDLPKETLIELNYMHGKNWFTLDGLWFRAVEERYGLEAAMELDLRMWQQQSRREAKRIKDLLQLTNGGPRAVLEAASFLTSMQHPDFRWEYEETEAATIYLRCLYCVPQETRLRNGLGEFPCKAAGLACFEGVAAVIDPKVRIKCLSAPPNRRRQDVWCEWVFASEGFEQGALDLDT